ncbi:signal peptidase II [Candidatus Pelagibacter sp.]|uniref:signal peptidase II n=1 Tax=Candidatus Pelagibacter sp. TaxID=2024849 RepID=UPI003F83BC2C
MVEKILRKNFIINLLLVFLIFLLDRISKIYVIYLDKKYNGAEIFSSKFLNINLIWNEGIAFGLFSFDNNFFYNFLTIFIFIIILIILFMIFKSGGKKKYALIAILGGAIGNFYDRIYYRAVPDFIDFHLGGFHWFIFNFADVFISLGVIFMILMEFIGNNRNNVKYEKL